MKTNRFARKGYDSSFTDIKSHAIFKAPVLHRINVGLEKFAVMKIINITICIFNPKDKNLRFIFTCFVK
jgi:hypothetical protein